MGSSVSKSSEETAAKKSNEASIDRSSANEAGILRSGNDGAIVRSGRIRDLKGLSKLITNDRDLDIYVHGLRKGFLFSALFLQCGALVCLAVAVQCACEMLILKLQEKIRDRKSKGVYDHVQDSAMLVAFTLSYLVSIKSIILAPLLSKLETWEKERESAVYMYVLSFRSSICVS